MANQTLRAELRVPDPDPDIWAKLSKDRIASKELIRTLGAFQQQITTIMVALATKGPQDVISVEFSMSFPERGIKKIEDPNPEPGRPGRCIRAMDCNGA